MSTRNPGWYGVNARRDYPLDDGAFCIDDNGNRLPTNLVVDTQLYFPATAGQVAAISAISSSKQLVSVIFAAADSFDSTSNTPLACVYLRKPIDIYRQYPLEAIYPGTGGWIAFGPGVNEQEHVAVFTSAAQSRLTPRAYRAYRPLPIEEIGRQGVENALTGLIHLRGGDDIKIAGDNVVIDGITRRCLVFSLQDKTSPASNTRNVLDIYRSPCLATPESETCGHPPPIEAIGVVSPNCCGAITIVLRGCAIPQQVTEEAHVSFSGEIAEITETYGVGGVILDCALGLTAACVNKARLPNEAGRLPNEYDDLCDYSYSVISENISWSGSTSFSFTFDPLDYEEESFYYSFNPETDSLSVSVDYTWEDLFTTDTGKWELKAGYMFRERAPIRPGDTVWALSTRHSNSLAGNNIIVCSAEETTTFMQKAAAVFSMYSGPAGSSHNAAVLAGVRTVNEKVQGYAAEVNWDSYLSGDKRFRIAKFVGSSWKTLTAVPIPSLSLGVDYRIGFSVFPRGENDAWLLAELVSLEGGGEKIATLGPIAVVNFTEGLNSYFGLATRRSPVRFTWFGIEDI